jgi:hypothetical protein
VRNEDHLEGDQHNALSIVLDFSDADLDWSVEPACRMSIWRIEADPDPGGRNAGRVAVSYRSAHSDLSTTIAHAHPSHCHTRADGDRTADTERHSRVQLRLWTDSDI